MADCKVIECGKVVEILRNISDNIEDVGDSDLTQEYIEGWQGGLQNAIMVLNKIPAADIRPERHGEWILDDSDEYANHFHCSRCGAEKDTCNEIYVEPPPPYCEHCGALMDGVR